jgi:hypothetical protein
MGMIGSPEVLSMRCNKERLCIPSQSLFGYHSITNLTFSASLPEMIVKT